MMHEEATAEAVEVEMEERTAAPKLEDRPAQQTVPEAAVTSPNTPGPKCTVYQGSNRVFCGGRCVIGPSMNYCLGAVVLIAIPCILFFAVIAPEMHWGWTAAGAFFLVFAFGMLIKTAVTDPGIYPRQEKPPSTVPSVCLWWSL
eukprot:Sspe_Gene.40473::Locus_19545_Transcript_1_1_Confidence_1.000_Length_536::g.40473::m.40473